jgi:hypothetical protein
MRGFISYARDDVDMLKEFRTHIKALKRDIGLEFWADPNIDAGRHWSTEIEQIIATADVFALLISPAFIASDFIYETEIPAIKERRKTGSALVVPVILSRCAWQTVAKELQAVPTDKGRLKPIDDWSRRRNGFDCAREQITKSVKRYFGINGTSGEWPGL